MTTTTPTTPAVDAAAKLLDIVTQATFCLQRGEERIVLDQVQASGEQLVFASSDGAVSVAFDWTTRARYATVKIATWQGIADRRRNDVALQLRLPKAEALHATELDYMTTAQLPKDGAGYGFTWQSPSHQFGVNPCGGFAVFLAEDDEEHDDILMDIWVNEGLPYPKAAVAQWDRATAARWLEDWQARFTSRSQMVVNAASLQELYDIVPYAEKAGIDEIYLFTNTWRPDMFWPITDVNWAVNKDVFPNGRADMRAYADHLAERGMRLNMHYVSGGFGLQDPEYVGAKPHPQLAAWGESTLSEAADAAAGDLRVSMPTDWDPFVPRPGFFDNWLLQVGDELIRPESVERDGEAGILIHGCQRGQYETQVAAHAVGAKVRFLVLPYDINLVPDNDSELLYEVADAFASLLNDANIAHAEFDGAEIHRYNGGYGYVKFAQRIYEQVDHPITSHDSSGGAARCFFEYRFKSTQALFRGTCRFTHGNWLIPFQVASATRPAANELDAQFFLSQGHWGGSLGMSKPEPMFGITTDMIATHGLSDGFQRILASWKAASRQLTEAQHARIEASLSKPAVAMPESSRHKVADTVFTVASKGEGGDLSLTPVQVMTRDTGDILWQLGQEYGPVSPRQFVQTGETLELNNRLGAQTPEVLLRVLSSFDADASMCDLPAAFADVAQVFDERDFFVEGNQPESSEVASDDTPNINLLPEGFEGRLHADASDEAKYNVADLPGWTFHADLSHHRGIALDVEGDGSGALVVVQLAGHGCRDYVFPIDFVGRRTLVVPSGEAAWAREDWGWRMGVKTMDYRGIQTCRLGLGMTPAGKPVDIRVHGLTALTELMTPLADPVVRVGDSELKVRGNITPGHYLKYTGGETASVYDSNWHLIEELPVAGELLAAAGSNRVVVTTASVDTPQPWLSCQLLVQGETEPIGLS